MNWIDLLIIIWLASAAVRGFKIGFMRQALSLTGFLLGLLIGGWLTPHLPKIGNSDGINLLAAVMISVLFGILLSVLGERQAVYLQKKLHFMLAHKVNQGLGIAVSSVFVLVASWLVASAASRMPVANIGLTIEQSAIIRAMDQVMPPAPSVMDRLGRLISPQGFPEVFAGEEPQANPAGPPSGPEVEAAAAKALGSTVRIEGFACGNISVGSGYVAASNYVVTNAHVVAGVRGPVILNQGKRYLAEVIWFNPRLDLAVLRTQSRLPGPPLPLAGADAPRGTSVAVLGYPGGGPLRVRPGIILRSQLAVGRDIYGRGLASRDIYAMQANIEPGNSGGPVVTADGKVAGVVFGEAVTQNGIGYALTATAINSDLKTALNLAQPVNTQACMPE